jgi:lysophospholipid acyltransferase (LPLAT)-like uncharacterized protein
MWSKTLRLNASDEDPLRKVHPDVPIIILLWHNRLFAVPLIVRRLWADRKVSALVSASRDGGVFSKFIGFLGLSAIRGSSSRFGRESFNEMIAAHKDGFDVAITPDGPRGPAYKMKAGALLVARRARAPILLVGVRYEKSWRLKSWNQFRVPKLFSSVEVRTILYEPESLPSGNDGLAELEERLLDLCGEKLDQ